MLVHNRVRHLVLLSLFTFMLLTVNCAFAADIYVTPVRPAAFGNGSLSTPFRNMSSAVRAAQPGDTVRLMAGVHGREFNAPACTSNCGGVLTPPHGGTVGNPITITSYPNPLDAIIDGNGQTASCVNLRYPNIIIDGLELRNCVQMGIMADGDSFGSYDAARSSGNYGGYGSRLYNNNGVDNTVIRNNYIHDCLLDAVKVTHSNNITVENNNMHNVSKTSGGHSIMQMNGIYGGVVRNNWMHDDLPIVNPHVMFFMKGGSQGITFENNLMENSAPAYAAIEIGDNMEWYNIRYTPSEIPGLNDRILTQSNSDNEIMPTAGGVYANSSTYQPEVLAEARNIVVRGNIVVNAGPPLSSRNGYNVKWYNNTLINCGPDWYKLWTDGYNGIAGLGYTSHAHVAKNQKFYNNLFYNDTVAVQNLGVPGRAYYVKDKDGDNYPLLNQEGLEMDYNQYYNMGYTWFSSNISKTVDTHALYNANPYLDSNYIPASGNAALTSGANLRTIGILGSSETWVDRYGVTRPTASEITNGYSIGAVVYIPSVSAPTAIVTAPANNAVISGTVSINASVTGSVSITKVEYYVNGVLKGSDSVSPYSFSWNTITVANGSYTIFAKSYDSAGNVGLSDNVAVTVNNTNPDTTPPTVSMSAPANNATVIGTVSVSASALDAVGVTKVEFYEDNVLKVVMNTTPYSYNLNTTSLANGSYTITARAYDAVGNMGQSAELTVVVNNPAPDLIVPTVTAFAIPATATSLVVPVTTFSASDNVAVSGYKITESATAPAASATGWSTTAPTSFTFSGSGSKTAYAWTKDAAGNVSTSRSAAVTITIASSDATAPLIINFAMPTTASSTTVPVTSLLAIDNVSVAGYQITESATAPAASESGWSTTAQTSFTFSAAGSRIAYAWTKDAAGNVSVSRSTSVTITTPPVSDTTAPVINTFALPTTASSLTVAVTSFTASDAVGVNGYLITESATVPAASTAGWSNSTPTSFSFSSAGSKTAYAWSRDAAGNVSASRSATVTIALPIAPTSLTINDALTALQIVVGMVQSTNDQKTKLDVAPHINGNSQPDGKIDVSDVIVILGKVTGKFVM